MRVEDMRLDGNAVGGQLLDLFARDVTAAMATCAGCGAVHALGALVAYGHTMGVVLRCPGCDAAVLRLARTPGWLRVDASGVRLLAIPAGAPPS